MLKFNRRRFLGAAAGSSGALALASFSPQVFAKASATSQTGNDWGMANVIRHATTVPQFPDADFDIRDYGAQGDAQTDCSQAFALAIAACNSSGGGRVLVTEGEYLTGPIHLLSNVNLHVAKGARILFITDPARYLPAVFTRWEGMEFMGYSPLIYAYRQQNIAITGEGELDGQADELTWWPWKGNAEWGVEGYPSQAEGRDELMADVANNVPPEDRHYAEGYYFRPPFVQPYLCENVLIEDITIVRSPFWLLNPVLCENVTVRGVHLESLGPNSDGCDPESCRNVVIENCFFDTGDDCIAIKSGRNNDGRRVNRPAENILIADCEMNAGHGGVVIGSEISGGAKNIFVENCRMSSPDLERGIRIKTNSVRGGTLEKLRYRDITIGQVKTAIVIDFYYEEGDAGDYDPLVADIEILNLECEQAEQVFQVRGFERDPIRDLRMTRCHFHQANGVGILEHVEGFQAHDVTINGLRL